jgi:hypothetical protein
MEAKIDSIHTYPHLPKDYLRNICREIRLLSDAQQLVRFSALPWAFDFSVTELAFLNDIGDALGRQKFWFFVKGCKYLLQGKRGGK